MRNFMQRVLSRGYTPQKRISLGVVKPLVFVSFLTIASPHLCFAGGGTALGKLAGKLTQGSSRADWSQGVFGVDGIAAFRRTGGAPGQVNSHGEMVYYTNPGVKRARMTARYQLEPEGDIYYFDINTGQTREAVQSHFAEGHLPPDAQGRKRLTGHNARFADAINVNTLLKSTPDPSGRGRLSSVRYDSFKVIETRNGAFRQTLNSRVVDATVGEGLVREFNVDLDGGVIRLNGSHRDSKGALLGSEFSQEYRVGGPGDRVLHAEMDESLRELRYIVLEGSGEVQIYVRRVEPFVTSGNEHGLFAQSATVDEIKGPIRANDTVETMDLITAKAQVFRSKIRQLGHGQNQSVVPARDSISGGIGIGTQTR